MALEEIESGKVRDNCVSWGFLQGADFAWKNHVVVWQDRRESTRTAAGCKAQVADCCRNVNFVSPLHFYWDKGMDTLTFGTEHHGTPASA